MLKAILKEKTFLIVPFTACDCVHVNALCFMSFLYKGDKGTDKSGHKKTECENADYSIAENHLDDE